MPSPKVILNAFLLVTVKVLNSYIWEKKFYYYITMQRTFLCSNTQLEEAGWQDSQKGEQHFVGG